MTYIGCGSTCWPTNTRARHVYRTSGFAEEGVMRNAYKLPDESRIDLVLMSLLRPDWTAMR